MHWIYLKEKRAWIREDHKMHVLTDRLDMSVEEIAREVEESILAIKSLEESEKETKSFIRGLKITAPLEPKKPKKRGRPPKPAPKDNEPAGVVAESKKEPVPEPKPLVTAVTKVNRTIQKLSPMWQKKAEWLNKIAEAKLKEPPEEPKKKKKKKRKKAVPKEVRQLVLVRDKYTCCSCGAKERLQVHHKVYRSKGGSDELTNLITLCEACHYEVHKDEPIGRLMKKRLDNDNDQRSEEENQPS